MNETNKNIVRCLDAYLFLRGKSSVETQDAFVHIPLKNISWVANVEVTRLDIGLSGGVIHLFETDNERDYAKEIAVSNSATNLFGPAYWIDEDVGELYQEILKYIEKE